MDLILAEAKRLYDLGFAIILLHQKSKRPKENNWTTGPRHPWPELLKKYKLGDNIGVRLGDASKIGGNYLACLDIDIKDKSFIDTACEKLNELFPGIKFPEVKSGSGNGSKHLYCVTSEPFKMITLLKEKGRGEVCVYSTGRQMVLAPSIHPDTKKAYAWAEPLDNIDALPLVDVSPLYIDGAAPKKKTSEPINDFVICAVTFKDLLISDKIRNMILTGEGVEDRSAMLLPISHALFKAGLNRDEILTLLTDTNYFMGRAAYDHAQTKSRMKAAEWLWKYTVKKVFDERDLDKKFAEPVAPSKELSFDEMSEQEKSFDELRDWKDDLDISEKGVYRATLKNTVDILKHEAGENCVKRNIFAYRDAYNIDTPWGGKNGAAITDDDTVKIKNWFGRNWGFEPNTNLVGEALSIIATDNAFDPVIDWLEALPPWDEVARLDTWLEKHFEAKIKKENAEACREYLAQVFRKWVFGMVLRAYKPGAKFDWMPIFEGPQGIGKSSFGRILVGEDLFLDWLPDLHDKDAALGLQGCWAVEMGELASMRKNEIEIVKAFVSRQVDKVRPPYGQRRIESPRRCVFFGTTNNATYLKDESGNRRFKPLEVGLLDFDKLSEDREQLFAEALWLFRSGFESEKTTELSGFARDFERIIQAEKMVQDEADLMAEKIDEFLQKETPNFDRLCFKIGDLFILNNVPGPIHFWRFDARNVQFAGKAVKKLGGSKYHTKIGSRWKMGRNV